METLTRLDSSPIQSVLVGGKITEPPSDAQLKLARKDPDNNKDRTAWNGTYAPISLLRSP